MLTSIPRGKDEAPSTTVLWEIWNAALFLRSGLLSTLFRQDNKTELYENTL